MANNAIASQTFNAVTAIGRFMPAVMFILADNVAMPMKEVLDWERQLADNPLDATCREVYADWLKEHGCPVRESQVRHEADMIRADNEPCPGWHVVRAAPGITTNNITNPGVLLVDLPIEWRYRGRLPV